MGFFNDGWKQSVELSVNNSVSGIAQTDFVTYISHKLGGNNISLVMPLSFFQGINRAATDGRDIRPSSDANGDTQLPFHLISYNPNVDSGTTTATTLNKLVQSGQNFDTTVEVGDRIYKTVAGVVTATALVTAIDSATTLSVDNDVFPSGSVFTIVRFHGAIKRSITSSTTSVYLWCGNSVVSALAVTDTYGRNNVYNPAANPYLAHYLLNEPTVGDDAIDHTGHGWDGTSGGTNKPSTIDGIFYRGQFFSGNNGTPAVEDRFNLEGTTTADWEGAGTTPPTAYTKIIWFKPSGSTGATQSLFSKRSNSGTFKGVEVQIANSPKQLTYVIDMGTSRILIHGLTTLSTSTWYCLMISVASSGVPSDHIMTLNGNNEIDYIEMLDGAVDSGTSDSPVAFHLVDAGQNFLTTVQVDDIVVNTTSSPNTFAKVTSVNSNTDLTLSADIFTLSSQAFSIFRSGNIDVSETFGIGSREGNASVSPYEGSAEITTYINNAQMTESWSLSHYENIANMSSFVTAVASTIDNQFPDDYDMNTYLVIKSKPDQLVGNLTGPVCVIKEKQVDRRFWQNIQDGDAGNLVAATADDGTGRIPIEIVKCVVSSEELILWFAPGSLTSGGGDKVFLFPKTTNGNTFTQPHWDGENGRNAVYTAIQGKMWMHLAEDATPGSTTAIDFYKDSTGNLNDGQGTFAPTRVAGLVGYAQQGNGSNRRIVLGDNGYPTGDNPSVMEAWMNLDGDNDEETPMGYGIDTDGRRRVLQQRSDGCGGHISNSFWGVANKYSGWTHIAWLIPTRGDSVQINETRIWINGVEMLTSNSEPFKLKLLSGTNLTLNTGLSQSQVLRGTSGVYATRPMAEPRLYLYEPADPTAWFRYSYYSQLDPANIWSLIPDEHSELRGRLKNFTGGFQ